MYFLSEPEKEKGTRMQHPSHHHKCERYETETSLAACCWWEFFNPSETLMEAGIKPNSHCDEVAAVRFSFLPNLKGKMLKNDHPSQLAVGGSF